MIIEKGKKIIYNKDYWVVEQLKEDCAVISRMVSDENNILPSFLIQTSEKKTVPITEIEPAYFYSEYFFLLLDNEGLFKPFKSKQDIGEFLETKINNKDYRFEIIHCRSEGITSIAGQLFKA